MHRPSRLETKYSNIFFYKSIAPTILKFYMEYDLAPESQNYKIGSGRISRMPPLLKIAKITKSTSSPEPLEFLAEFWHGILMEHRYLEL